jgi:hypothetical protein
MKKYLLMSALLLNVCTKTKPIPNHSLAELQSAYEQREAAYEQRHGNCTPRGGCRIKGENCWERDRQRLVEYYQDQIDRLTN